MGATELILVRHGESTANVAATAALRAGAEAAAVGVRDADAPLSGAGRRQGQALGRWFAGLPPGRRPTAVWCSPYLRARRTAALAGLRGLRLDERLRDREQGILELLTPRGVAARFPEEARRRQRLGRFAYRPPGGESWTDVALRLRSVLGDIDAAGDGRRVAVLCHDAVILLIRYVCEGLDEDGLLALDGVSNGSVTRLLRPTGRGFWTLDTFNSVEHLRAAGAPVTEHPGDDDAQPRN